MSLAGQLFIDNCKQILSQGTWDTDQVVRPRWEDGTPAHTIKMLRHREPLRPAERSSPSSPSAGCISKTRGG